jgi:hypothetical protein
VSATKARSRRATDDRPRAKKSTVRPKAPTGIASTLFADVPAALDYMNRRHAIVREGGRTVVLNLAPDAEPGDRRITRSSLEDLRAFYDAKFLIRSSGDDPGVGSFWLAHPLRRQYAGVIFDPDAPAEVGDLLNLWTGFAVKPRSGSWRRLHDHIRENVCRGDDALTAWFLAWLAQGVQEPGTRPESAVVLRSDERGTGKSLLCRFYRQLFGHHGREVSNAQHLTGRFNAHLEDCCCLVLTEAFWAGSHSADAVLKALVTDDTLAIEPKGQDLRFVPNRLRILMTSNSEWAIPAGLDERRFLVLDVSAERRQQTDYFGELVGEMENGGLAAMLFDLQRRDISGVDLRRPPNTAGLLEQKVRSLSPADRWLFGRLSEGQLLPGAPWGDGTADKRTLHAIYADELRATGVRRAMTPSEFGAHLKRVFGGELRDWRPSTRGIKAQGRPRAYVFPPLDEARAIFTDRLGGGIVWEAPAEAEPATESHPARKAGKILNLSRAASVAP